MTLYVLVLIIMQNRETAAATVPDPFMSFQACTDAGEAWQTNARKAKLRTTYVCFPAEGRGE